MTLYRIQQNPYLPITESSNNIIANLQSIFITPNKEDERYDDTRDALITLMLNIG